VPSTIRAAVLFISAACCELGGAYLVWLWWREGRAAAVAAAGLVALFAYALLQSQQAFIFGRAFAAYGGVFIVAAQLWGWWIDGRVPDRWDLTGAAICLLGVSVMLWGPRR
jgi:small multidrug resistance family-3 protein